MKKFASLLVIAILLLLPALAHAQQPLKLSSLTVELWPEYDRSSILVITHLSLDASVSLPTEVALRIPLDAEVNAVASRDMDGQLLNVNYNKETTGAWQTVRMQVALADLQIEYYDDSLKIDGTDRSFTYQWPGDFQVTSAVVTVQQPIDASGVTITPGPVTSQNNSADGLTYFLKEVGSLNAGQSFKLDVGYKKSSDRLTAETMQVSPSEPLPSEAAKENNFDLWWAVGLGALGLLLIGGGVLWYWRSSQQETTPRRRSRSRASDHSTGNQAASSEGIYCQQCGRRASAGDRFCRSCGTRLRVE